MIFRYRRFCASNLRPPPSPPQPAGCSLPHCWAKLSLRFPSCTPQPSGSLSQSLFLTIWKIFFNVDMVDSVHLLLLQLQKSIVGPGSGASLVVLAKAPPLSWCWCKPSSGVSVSSPSQPVFPAGWCCGGTLQLLQRLSRPHNGLCSAPRICTRPGCTRDTMVHRSFRLGVPMHIDKDVQSGD